MSTVTWHTERQGSRRLHHGLLDGNLPFALIIEDPLDYFGSTFAAFIWSQRHEDFIATDIAGLSDLVAIKKLLQERRRPTVDDITREDSLWSSLGRDFPNS